MDIRHTSMTAFQSSAHLEKKIRMKRRGFLLSATAAATAGMTALSAPPIGANANAAVRIGAVLPLSGPLNIFGQQARLGLELALAEIRESGGFLDQDIEIDYRDEASVPGRAEAAATELIANPATLAIAGPITSASRNALSPVVEASGVPLLYATDYEGGDCGPRLFYFNSVPNQTATPLMSHLMDQSSGPVFFLGADYIWPHRMFDACGRVVADRLGSIVGREFVPLDGLSDYTPILAKIKSSGAGILVLALPGAAQEDFITAAQSAGWFSNLTVGLLGSPVLYSKALQAAGLTAVSCVPFVESDPSASVQAFVERVRKLATVDGPVSAYVATHYSALLALRAACEAIGSATREAATSGLSGLDYAAPNGMLTLDPSSNHTTLRMYVTQVSNAGLQILQDPHLMAPEAACVAGA
ncbi:MAG: ABC transporter substrate-binding protein [Pseudomonadota bacterium]